MKAERRHELKENALAKQATRVVKVMQLPDLRRKWAGRAILTLAIALVIIFLVINRISNSRASTAAAGEMLADASRIISDLRQTVVPGRNSRYLPYPRSLRRLCCDPVAR